MIHLSIMKKKNDIISEPKVSIVVPVHFSQRVLANCLDSIFKQDYPKNKIEVIVVISKITTDNSEAIARRYPVKILINERILGEPAKTLGYKHCTGEFYMYIDDDAELVSKTWIRDMVKPLVENPHLAGSFTRFMVKPTQTAFNRFVSLNPLQLWPMLAYLLPKIEEVTIRKNNKYDIVKINPKHTIPVGMGLFRKKMLDEVIENPDKFIYVDIAVPIQLAERGYDELAYVSQAGFYHESKNLFHQLKRIRRDVVVTYLPVVGQRRFHYVDFSKPQDLLKIIYWIVYVNLLIPSLLVGIYKTIRYRDWAGMYELPVNLLCTNYVIWLFITEKNGQELIRNLFLRRSVASIKSRQLDHETGSKFSLTKK